MNVRPPKCLTAGVAPADPTCHRGANYYQPHTQFAEANKNQEGAVSANSPMARAVPEVLAATRNTANQSRDRHNILLLLVGYTCLCIQHFSIDKCREGAAFFWVVYFVNIL